MIKNFRHKGLEHFFIRNDPRLLKQQHCNRISRILDRLDGAEIIQDMNAAGYKLHRLIGDQKDRWSVWVSGNWRITFKFINGDAYAVDLEDYH